MCDQNTIDGIDNGKIIPIKRSYMLVSLLIAVVTVVFTVAFWISGTNNAIAQNQEHIIVNATEITELQKAIIAFNEHFKTNNSQHNDIIYNITKLLKANGQEWESLPK